jgi:hypothetical protein
MHKTMIKYKNEILKTFFTIFPCTVQGARVSSMGPEKIQTKLKTSNDINSKFCEFMISFHFLPIEKPT